VQILKTLFSKEKRVIRMVLGVVLGAAAGYAYYRFVGCSSGTCPLTSSPLISTLYGAAVGALFGIG
jgi:hypothetical protein